MYTYNIMSDLTVAISHLFICVFNSASLYEILSCAGSAMCVMRVHTVRYCRTLYVLYVHIPEHESL